MTGKITMKRGDIYLTTIPYSTFNPTQTKGTHFYVIVSTDKTIEKRTAVQAIPLTSKIDRVLYGEKVIHLDGFHKPSKLMASQLSLFPKSAFLCGKKIGSVSAENMKEIDDCIREQLALS